MTTETHTQEEHHDPPYMLIFFVLIVMTLAEVGYGVPEPAEVLARVRVVRDGDLEGAVGGVVLHAFAL